MRLCDVYRRWSFSWYELVSLSDWDRGASRATILRGKSVDLTVCSFIRSEPEGGCFVSKESSEWSLWKLTRKLRARADPPVFPANEKMKTPQGGVLSREVYIRGNFGWYELVSLSDWD